MTKLTETAPKEIYLCIGVDDDEKCETFPYDAAEYVCWSERPVLDLNVRYIRADLSSIEIQRLQEALHRAAIDLIESSRHLDFYISEAGYDDDTGDAQDARDAAARATAAAMSGSELA